MHTAKAALSIDEPFVGLAAIATAVEVLPTTYASSWQYPVPTAVSRRIIVACHMHRYVYRLLDYLIKCHRRLHKFNRGNNTAHTIDRPAQ